jgi:hypothetical protein
MPEERNPVVAVPELYVVAICELFRLFDGFSLRSALKMGSDLTSA